MEQEELPLSLKDQFLISPLGQWAVLHQKLLLNVGTAVAAIAIFALVQTVRTPNVEGIRHVQETYAAWKAKPEDQELYCAFEQALKKAPNQQIASPSEIAQLLLNAGRVDEAQAMAKKSLMELRAISPHHAEFAEISLLIGRKSYQEALERSVSLKEKMQNQSSLTSHNLQRIAFLQQQLGNPAGELAAWKDLEEFATNNKTLQEKSLKGLGDQTIGFQSYVEERKKRL
jgi:hypothetical protein